MVGSSVTGETQSSVDNTSQASVTTPEMAAAGYQQDPAEPDHSPAACRVIPPVNKAYLSNAPYLNKAFTDKKALQRKRLVKLKAWQTKRPPEAVFMSSMRVVWQAG
jgi:hypothetical protein